MSKQFSKPGNKKSFCNCSSDSHCMTLSQMVRMYFQYLS